MDEKEPKKTNGYQIFQSSDCEDSSTDEVSTCNETDEELTETSSRPVAKIILQLFWSSIEGDFAWPVASFPVNKFNAKTIGNCVWSTISILSELKFGRNNDKKVQVPYGGTGESMMADSRKKISLWFLHSERDRRRYINTLWSYNHL